MNFDIIPKSVLSAITRTLLKLPKPVLRMVAGKPILVDSQELDLYCQLVCKFGTFPESLLDSVADYRAEYELTGDLLGHTPAADVECIPISLESAEANVACEMHRPKNLPAKQCPVLIYYHGGGHVIGSFNTHRKACRQLAVEANCIVIAVDYRLAPEHKFPAGIEDSLFAYDEIVKRYDDFGINPDRIAIGGDSAGANIAAVVAQQRKAVKHPPYFQLLIVPWLDMSQQSNSYSLFSHGCQLEKYTMEWYTKHYLNTPEDGSNVLASPLLGDVKDVCPAAVLVAGFDPLRDEGLAYGEQLKHAGIDTTVKCFTGQIHPYMNFAGFLPSSRLAFEETARLLKEGLEPRAKNKL